jgi:hypothetical protein
MTDSHFVLHMVGAIGVGTMVGTMGAPGAGPPYVFEQS